MTINPRLFYSFVIKKTKITCQVLSHIFWMKRFTRFQQTFPRSSVWTTRCRVRHAALAFSRSSQHEYLIYLHKSRADVVRTVTPAPYLIVQLLKRRIVSCPPVVIHVGYSSDSNCCYELASRLWHPTNVSQTFYRITSYWCKFVIFLFYIYIYFLFISIKYIINMK